MNLRRSTHLGLAFLLAAVCLAKSRPTADTTNPAPDSLVIIHPADEAVISSNSMPLACEVNVPGKDVRFVEFLVCQYIAGINEADSQGTFQHTCKRLARDTAPPYQTIWDVSQVQDHSYGRIQVIMYALFMSGGVVTRVANDFTLDRNAAVATNLRALSPRRPPDVADYATFRNSDNEIRFGSWWSRDSLFFDVRVRDRRVVTSEETKHPHDSAWWLGDDIEIFVDPHNTKSPLFDSTCRQLVLHPDGKGSFGTVGDFRDTRRPLSTVGQRTDSGFVVGCAVAWGELGIEPNEGRTLGLDVTCYDRDQPDGLLSIGTWAGLTLANHHNASEWGHLELKGRAWPWQSVLAGIMTVIVAIAGIGIGAKVGRKRGDVKSQPSEQQSTGSGIDTASVGDLTRRALQVADAEYADPDCNLERVAQKLDRNPGHVSKVFKKDTGTRFTDYLNGKRLANARKLIESSGKSIREISLESGYANYSYFVRMFKRHFGMSPSEARRQEGPTK